jgi:hypothetical protein
MTSSSDGLALQIEDWLAEQVAALDLDRRKKGPGRPRVLPALLLWTGLVVCVVRGMGSQAALWRLLTQRGLWSFPRLTITDDAVRVRLARDGTAPLSRLFTQVTTLLAARIPPWIDTKLAPFATDILVIDEITLDKVARLLPTLRELPAGDPGLLAGTLAALFDVRRQQWRRIIYREDTLQNEKVAARSRLEGLAHGTLLLCDLGYFGFKWFDALTDGGFFWLSRLRSKTTFDPILILYKQGDTLDAIVWLGKYRADRAKHAVRLIQFAVNGRQYRYLTGCPLGGCSIPPSSACRTRHASTLAAGISRWRSRS